MSYPAQTIQDDILDVRLECRACFECSNDESEATLTNSECSDRTSAIRIASPCSKSMAVKTKNSFSMRGKRANFCSNELENCATRAYNVRTARVHDTHVHMYARNARICTSAYVCTRTHVHAYTHAYMRACAHMCARMHAHVCA